MSRRILITVAFLWAMIGLSQVSFAQVVTGTFNGAPVMNGSTVMLGTGPATPEITYAAPPPTAGISNAGRAGISNTVPSPTTIPVTTNTVVYYNQPGVQSFYGGQPGAQPVIAVPAAVGGVTPVVAVPEASVEAAPEASPAAESTGAGGAVTPAPKIADDFGPSSFGGAVTSANATAPAPGANSMSLAQVAAQYKTAKTGLNAR